MGGGLGGAGGGALGAAGAGGVGAGGAPPGSTVIRVTEEEKAAIERVTLHLFSSALNHFVFS